MKKGFVLITLMVFPAMGFGQTVENKERNHKWGLGIAINSVEAQIGTALQSVISSAFTSIYDRTEKSYSISLIPKIFIRDNIIIRFELSITNIHFQNSQNSIDNAYHNIDKRNLKHKIYKLNPGVQWNCLSSKYIEIYCGATINSMLFDQIIFNIYGETRQMPTDTLLAWSSAKTIYKGGFALGIGAYSGFNIFINKHISTGAEFSTSFLYNKIGGGFYSERIFQNLPNPVVSEMSGRSSNLYKGLQFSKILSSLNISLWF